MKATSDLTTSYHQQYQRSHMNKLSFSWPARWTQCTYTSSHTVHVSNHGTVDRPIAQQITSRTLQDHIR